LPAKEMFDVVENYVFPFLQERTAATRRANPRVIKRKYVKWHVKRARHRDWPRPTRPATATIIQSN